MRKINKEIERLQKLLVDTGITLSGIAMIIGIEGDDLMDILDTVRKTNGTEAEKIDAVYEAIKKYLKNKG